MRNRKVLPKDSNRPILAYFKSYEDDRAYIIYPTGLVECCFIDDKCDGFTSNVLINNPDRGYSNIREDFQYRINIGWKLLHWEYL